MSVRINGETWACGSSDNVLYGSADMIAWVGRDEMLPPSEFLGSGTMGCGSEQGRFLSNGDVIEAEVEGIGVLRNRVARQDVAQP